MKGCINNINTISTSVSEDLEVNDPPSEFTFDEMTLMVGKETTDQLNGSTFDSNHGSLQMPILEVSGEGGECLKRQVNKGICINSLLT